jgi:dihydrolipoamide dehydrogenase
MGPMDYHYDIAVLGTGPGGYIAALKGAQLGARVVAIEQHPFFGGTCLNWGCIPSKALIASSELLHHIQHASEMGIEVSGPVSACWPAIQKRKDRIVQTLRNGIQSLFTARKVVALHGRAVLDGTGRIMVQREGSPFQQVTADRIILAVGSKPAWISGWPTGHENICTSEEALHWADLPRSVMIVGGGAIGCEFACMLQPLGISISIVEMMPQLLPGQDSHLASNLQKIFHKRGIRCHLQTTVKDLALSGESVKALLSNGQGIEVEKVLLATGRLPSTGSIGLETIGMNTDRGFVRVNERMETAVPGYYCIGDANGLCLLAHAAMAHGVTAAENACGQTKAFSAPIPSCVYTFPEIASVGLTQEAARAQGLPVSVGAFPFSHLGKTLAAGDTEGFAKFIRHRESGELLGVHLLGHNVTEIIAAAASLLHCRVNVHEIREVVFAHPTASEALHEAAEDSLGIALHLPPRKVLRVAV